MLRPPTRLITVGLRTPCFQNISIQPAKFVARETLKPSRTLQSRSYATPAGQNPPILSWNEFLRLRRQRLFLGTIASIPCSIGGFVGGLVYFGSSDIDPTQTILGMDPFIMTGVFVLGCGALGWLLGPSIGRGVWQLFHMKQARLMNTVCCLVP